MGKVVKKTERLTQPLQVMLTEKDIERLKNHPLVQKKLTEPGPLARASILERLDEEEKHQK
jgi:hypothetical protein